MPDGTGKARTRIQRRNRDLILEAALDVFSTHGFRGATLDQIASAAGLSKPNLLYYFASKEAIHADLMSGLLDTWLDPLREMDADGEPIAEILAYVDRKLEMSRLYPRESRLFANEILQGAPRMLDNLQGELKHLVDDKVRVLLRWMDAGQIAKLDPHHLIFSVWALTQHYADFDVQIRAILDDADPFDAAPNFVETLFRKLLRPDS
ncbi:TetR family transcriptional regulator C-terminal domain-containing protein [Litoreibacter arenae]|uniref:Transcriptional regulator RutR of pyrimidine catabolism (TetR family) n=1 Tax=Litoreibacter arenae DSM 19593 TaxID=1123360 RepID=S9QHZ8_9RHOB|nr:TetR family transcriptional regulator C-terminal domain-containing protein [Litoreibacter arenae]EPX79457.1 Transcriptional regulator RutR of pyrimidine catabolism (TetR family) [Litoreibacter arenae DSM 19593]